MTVTRTTAAAGLAVLSILIGATAVSLSQQPPSPSSVATQPPIAFANDGKIHPVPNRPQPPPGDLSPVPPAPRGASEGPKSAGLPNGMTSPGCQSGFGACGPECAYPSNGCRSGGYRCGLHLFGDDDECECCRIYDYCVPPLGASVNAVIAAQRAHGEAARMVLYDYDFIPNTAVLKPRGIRQLDKIAAMLPSNAYPVIVEASYDNHRLDEARRQAVYRGLAEKPFPVLDERVVIGGAPSRALDGSDAEAIHHNLNHLMIRGSYRPYFDANTPSSIPTNGGESIVPPTP